MREALSAVTELSESHPELATVIAARLPEVDVLPVGETVW